MPKNTERERASALADAIVRHTDYGRENGLMMGMAILAIKGWNDGTHTLAHSVALTLAEVYKAGQEGRELDPGDYTDIYAQKAAFDPRKHVYSPGAINRPLREDADAHQPETGREITRRLVRARREEEPAPVVRRMTRRG